MTGPGQADVSDGPLHFIPKETLSAYQRWEMASLDAPSATSRPVPANGSAGNGAGSMEAANAAEQAALRDKARADGFAAGQAEGLARAAAQVERLTQLLHALGNAAEGHEQRLADAVLDLSLVLARQLAGEALAVRREMLLPLIVDALAQLPELTQRVRLHLDPADVELVRTLTDAHPALETCHLVPDATVGTGGFRVETEQSAIDGTLATRWQRLAGNFGRSYEWLDHT
jgi:flagellar assembly protein FliH